MPNPLLRMVRDVLVAIVLLFVAWQLFSLAERRGPEFGAGDIRVVEAAVAAFTTVQVFETAPAPNINTQQGVSRAAIRLEGYPPNLLAYIPGSPWRLENDIPVGTTVRLEAAVDPEALAEQARAFPKTEFLLTMEGLQVGERIYFRAGDEIARAEEAARRLRLLGAGAAMLGVGWLVWVSWTRRGEALGLVDEVMEARWEHGPNSGRQSVSGAPRFFADAQNDAAVTRRMTQHAPDQGDSGFASG